MAILKIRRRGAVPASLASLAFLLTLGAGAFAEDSSASSSTLTLAEMARVEALATEYGVEASEIQAYLDEGYRLGDVDMALEIAEQSGATFAEVMALGEAGDRESWIEAAEGLGATVSPPGGGRPMGPPPSAGAPRDESDRVDSLATEYGVEASEIQAYLDTGYRIGDVDMALEIAEQSGATLAEVIALGEAGDRESWIEAAEDLGATIVPPDKPADGAEAGRGRGPGSGANAPAGPGEGPGRPAPSGEPPRQGPGGGKR